MYITRKITPDIYWVGGNDRRLALFENLFPIPEGVSYNAYAIVDEKIALLDTVDHSISVQYLENVEHILQGRTPDYLIINHMEPDHCATLYELCVKYPQMELVVNSKTQKMIAQFFTVDLSPRMKVVAENETLPLGKHNLQFVMAPMVHWPEVMIALETTTGTLFSADAFGTFGTLDGTIFADELDFHSGWMEQARRYYTNIVGKFGVQVQTVLKKAASMDIHTICPLHGPIWRNNLNVLLEKYDLWSRYQPEENGVLIVYGSMYGNTENAANLLASELAEAGVKKISVKDVSVTHVSYLIGEAFRYSHIVLLAPTYNNGIFPAMEHFILDMQRLSLQNRTFAVVDNGTWGPMAGKQMKELLSSLKNSTVLPVNISLVSTVNSASRTALVELAATLAEQLQ